MGHCRLQRAAHHGTADLAVSDATRILRWWARSIGSSTELSARPDVDIYLTAYPDLVDLACILANARNQIWTATPAGIPARSRAIDAVYTAIAVRFPEHRGRTVPVDHWIHD